MHLAEVSQATEELYEALQRLIPQLGPHKIPPTLDELRELIGSKSILLEARDPDEKGPIVGILCLTIYRVPTGVRSIIEDMVVDETMRRRGIGEALVQRAIELARRAGAGNVSLSSNPQRVAANQMYQSMGFELRKTNPYIFKLK